MAQSPNKLKRFAPEIRNVIFEYALRLPITLIPKGFDATDENRATTIKEVPTLLAALRAAPDLYEEALEVFYRSNRFILDIDSFRNFCRLKGKTVQLIRNLYVDLRTEDGTKEYVREFLRLFTNPRSHFRFATGVRVFAFISYYQNPVIFPLIDNGIRKWQELRRCAVFARYGTVKEKDFEEQVLDYLAECLETKETMQHSKMEQVLLESTIVSGCNFRLKKAYGDMMQSQKDPKHT